MLVTEPYLGAKGSFHPPQGYLRQLNDWCNENSVVFILDEVQSCHGRAGNMYAFQTHGLDPDLVVLGKGIGNGEPVAVVVGRAAILNTFDYGEASDTYSGNPRACAAILAVLDTFERFPILKNCRQISKVIEEGLYRLTEDFEFATYSCPTSSANGAPIGTPWPAARLLGSRCRTAEPRWLAPFWKAWPSI